MVFNSNMNSLANTDLEIKNLNSIREPEVLAPEQYTKMLYPELIERYRKTNSDYILPGMSLSQPRLNSDELRDVNGMSEEVLQGDGIGKLFKKGTRTINNIVKKGTNNIVKQTNNAKKLSKKSLDKVIDDIANDLDDVQLQKFQNELHGYGIKKDFKRLGKTIRKTANKTGKVIKKTAYNIGDDIKKNANKTIDDIKHSAVDKDGLIRKLIKETADIVIPELGSALGSMASTYMTGDPISGKIAGEQLGNLARRELKKQTGYGIGKYASQLDKKVSKYTNHVIDGPKKLIKKIGKGNGKSRNAIVRDVMKSEGLSLPEASKFVKENGLY